MTSFLEQLFSLRKLTLSDPGVRFEFARGLPLWAWVFLIAACIALAAWSYSRLLGPLRSRSTLGAIRSLTLVAVLVLIAGPQLIRNNERVERDWIVVMLDRSASMRVADDGADRATRESRLAKAISSAWPSFNELSKERNLLFVGFDAGVFDLRVIAGSEQGGGGIDLGDPAGRRTAIGRALDQVLRRVAARPVAGIVLITDGRSSDAPSRSTLRQIDARQIPIYCVPLGSETPLTDFSIARVDAPSSAFLNDIVPINVEVERRGGADVARVELVDRATNEVLDSRPVPPMRDQANQTDSSTEQLVLTARPDREGSADWTVRVVPERPDLSRENNSVDFRVELVGRPIRVVYFDGYPRWEYRYLKNLLVRESSVASSCLLLASDRRYIQEGTEPLDVMPRTPQAWAPFDVIIMGDVRPELFSEEQLKQIKELVSSRGAGLMWIGGAGPTPGAWKGTPLADLLPFTMSARDSLDSTSGAPRTWLQPVVMLAGPGAQRLAVLRLGEQNEDAWPSVLSDASNGWPLLRWAQRIEHQTLKPTAEVLAFAAPVSSDSISADAARAAPLVVTMRYGAGRTVYVATDEIWRYRYARGEALPERFYLPLIRLLARESLGRTGKPATLEAAPNIAHVDQQVRITARLLDQSLVERRPPSVSVRVRSSPGDRTGSVPTGSVEVELKPESAVAVAGSSSMSTFIGTWVPFEPGRFIIDSADPTLAGLDLSAEVQVVLPDDEMRTPQADHALLASLAKDTGGAVVQPSQLSDTLRDLPNRQLRVLGTPDVETLWDKPVVWILLMVLLCGEWIGRRLIRLP